MRFSASVVLLPLSLLLCACGSPDKHYTLRGRVVSKVPESHTLVVDHDNIPGFMAAMTMPYQVAQGMDLAGIEPGDRIEARIVVKPDQQYWLDRISVTDSSHREKVVKETKQLYPGEMIPDVDLLNRDGNIVHLSDFRGKTVLLSFIYTRCPMPNFCPRLSSLFASVDRELEKNPNEYRRTQLLSIQHRPEVRHAGRVAQVRPGLSPRRRKEILTLGVHSSFAGKP